MEMYKLKTSSVPWFNKEEWKKVFDLLYSANTDLKTQSLAMDIIKMWKIRHIQLPAGVEGTLILLQVIINNASNNEENLKIMYSNAILRFLNICAAYDTKQGTFSKTAKNAHIPLWIVNLRHDIAHNPNLPTKDLLERAIHFSYDWLYDNYWRPVSTHLYDYSLMEQNQNNVSLQNPDFFSANIDNLYGLIRTIECLLISQHMTNKMEKLGDIKDEQARNHLIVYLRKATPFDNVSNDTLINLLYQSLVRHLVSILENDLEAPSMKLHLLDALIDGDVFLSDPELQIQLFQRLISESLPWSFVLLWQDVFQMFVDLNLLNDFILKLIAVQCSDKELESRQHMAALWLCEIVKSFQRLKLIRKMIELKMKRNKISDNLTPKTIRKCIKELEKKYPNLKEVIMFDLSTTTPDIFTDLKKFQTIALKNPNKFTSLYCSSILSLMEPPLMPNLKDQIINLTKCYLVPENDSNSSNLKNTKIYSKEDLNTHFEFTAEKIYINQFDNKKDDDKYFHEEMSDEIESENDDEVNNNHWKRAPVYLNLKDTPLGVLPWQKQNTNPSLQKLFTAS